VRISNTSNASDDTSDDYTAPAGTPGSQQQDDALAQAALRRDLPAWEYKINVSNAPYGVPRVVKMHSGGWRMEMAPRIRKDTARQMPDEQQPEAPIEQPAEQLQEAPTVVPSEQPTAAPVEQLSEATREQPDAAGDVLPQEPPTAHGASTARRMLLV
jgi:hypothetical protein